MSTTLSNEGEDLISFWKKVFDQNASLASIPFETYDFYHDCILRHCGKHLTAVKDKENAWSYDDIHTLVGYQLPFWKNHGLSPGQKVTLVFSHGIDFIVALMTALKLGLSFSLSFLDDPLYSLERIERKIKEEQPQWIVTSLNHQKWEKQTLHWNLEIQEENTLEEPSHAYLPVEEISPQLDANKGFLCPLRDGLITLSLKPGTTWAHPLGLLSQEEPFITLATFLAGATLLLVSDSTLEQDPLFLKETPIEVLSISPRLLELWTQNPGVPKSKLKLWTLSPLLGNLPQKAAFVEQNALAKIPHLQVHIQTKQGGITLASKTQPYQSFISLKPSPGIPWKILELNGSNQVSWEGVGLFSLDPSLILGETPDGFVISKIKKPIRKGVTYPSDEIESIIQECEGVHECMIVENQTPLDLIGSRLTLLIFAPDQKEEDISNLNEKLNILLCKQLGEGNLPDRILSFPLYPRKKDGKLDRQWVLGQYHEGNLSKKTKSSLHLQLSHVRNILYKELERP